MQDFFEICGGHNMVTISLEQIKWVHYAGFFTVSQYVFLVLMVAMGPHPCPFPSPSPFSTKCRLLSSWPALVEKGEGGWGRGTIVVCVHKTL